MAHELGSHVDHTTDVPAAIVAVFEARDGARAALDALHDVGFRHGWLGVTAAAATAAGEPLVRDDDAGGFLASLGRFFSGDAEGGRALHQALIDHGASELQARRIDGMIAPGNAVVTVDPENDPDAAIAILQRHGGLIDRADDAPPTSGTLDAATAMTAGAPAGDRAADEVFDAMPGRRDGDVTRRSALAARDDVADEPSDVRRLQLREERLAVDTEPVARGEARIGKAVVEEPRSIDVPIVREELFIERRPVAGDAANTSPVIEGEEVRIPLVEERVTVEKRPVVTEEVVVRKRRVADTRHVSETVRREELRVEDPTQVTAEPEDRS